MTTDVSGNENQRERINSLLRMVKGDKSLERQQAQPDDCLPIMEVVDKTGADYTDVYRLYCNGDVFGFADEERRVFLSLEQVKAALRGKSPVRQKKGRSGPKKLLNGKAGSRLAKVPKEELAHDIQVLRSELETLRREIESQRQLVNSLLDVVNSGNVSDEVLAALSKRAGWRAFDEKYGGGA